MLVGDVVQAIREAITDQPPTMLPPTLVSLAATSVAGGNLGANTYFIKLSAFDPWGESLPSTEMSVVVGGGQNAISIAWYGPAGNNGTIRVYVGFSANGQDRFVQFTNQSTSPFNLTDISTASGGFVATRSTAYLPDLDGDSFSASTLFNWVNDALSLASNICGGLIDYSGVQTQVGQPMYVVVGKWQNIPDVWYDGYPLAPDKAGNFFRRNSITASVLSQVTTTLLSDRMMLEVWPQPSRTGSSTTLSAPMSVAQTTAPAVNIGGFLLTNGAIQVDSEIMMYNGQSGSTFRNLIRGVGGTIAVAHSIGAPVLELNLFFHGWRTFSINYQPGQSMNTVFIPDEWSPLLPIYGLARVKLAEQDLQGYQALKKDFETSLQSWFKQNKVTTGPRQIGDASNNLEVIPSLGGGWVVP